LSLQLVSIDPLLAAEWLFPVAFFVSITSFLRWKLMIVGGISGVLSGSLWIFGINLIRSDAGSQISGWFGYGGKKIVASVDAQVGAYLTILGGLFLGIGILPNST
jgi:hypothetical protein